MTVAECRLVNPAPRRSTSSRSRQCRRRRRRRPSSSRYRSTIAEDDAPARSSEGEALAHHDVFVSLIFSQRGASPSWVMCILQECAACDYDDMMQCDDDSARVRNRSTSVVVLFYCVYLVRKRLLTSKDIKMDIRKQKYYSQHNDIQMCRNR